MHSTLESICSAIPEILNEYIYICNVKWNSSETTIIEKLFAAKNKSVIFILIIRTILFQLR